MRKLLRKRIRGRGGFSLAELLVTVLILTMVSGVVGAGVPMAANAYHKVVEMANAQVLLSTTMTAMRSELEAARKVITHDSGGMQELDYFFRHEYRSDDLDIVCSFRNSINEKVLDTDPEPDQNPGIWFQPYMLRLDSGSGEAYRAYPEASHLLVSAEAATYRKNATARLYTRYEHIYYDSAKKMFIVTGLQVIRSSQSEGESIMAQAGDFYIPAMNMIN